MPRTINVVTVDFDNPGGSLPSLRVDGGSPPGISYSPRIVSNVRGVTCESARQFYSALRERGAVKGDAEDFTIFQYESSSGGWFLQVRNACCVGDSCAMGIERGVVGDEIPLEEFEKRLFPDPGRDEAVLILEEGIHREPSARALLESLGKQGNHINYVFGPILFPTSRYSPRIIAA